MAKIEPLSRTPRKLTHVISATAARPMKTL
jgi:hypothetical protein